MQRTKSFLIALGVVGFAVTGASAADGLLTDAKEILKKADQATRKIQFASYNASYRCTGWLEERIPQVTGKAVVGPDGDYKVPRFFCEAILKKKDSEETQKYTAGCNGDEYFLLDPKTKKAHHDIDPIVLGSASRDIQRLVLREFTSDEPFKDELEAEKVELKGTRTIDGVLCYDIEVALDGTSPRAIVWTISTNDFLPRGVKRIYPGREEGDADGTTEMTISNLVAKTTMDKKAFEMVVPPGYTATNDFPE